MFLAACPTVRVSGRWRSLCGEGELDRCIGIARAGAIPHDCCAVRVRARSPLGGAPHTFHELLQVLSFWCKALKVLRWTDWPSTYLTERASRQICVHES